MIGPFTTKLCAKLGCRVLSLLGAFLFSLALFLSSYVHSIYQLYATYSFLLPIGGSSCYFTSILILDEYFSKKLALANGIGLSGCGVGTLVMAPLMNVLLEKFHWRKAERIFSGVTSVGLGLCSLIYFIVPAPTQLHVAQNSNKTQKLVDLSQLKNKAFAVWVAVVGFVLFGAYMPYVHLVSDLLRRVTNHARFYIKRQADRRTN